MFKALVEKVNKHQIGAPMTQLQSFWSVDVKNALALFI
jgi:hypothetical protein